MAETTTAARKPKTKVPTTLVIQLFIPHASLPRELILNLDDHHAWLDVHEAADLDAAQAEKFIEEHIASGAFKPGTYRVASKVRPSITFDAEPVTVNKVTRKS